MQNYFDKIYFCSGARNAPLINFFESSKEYILDERVASFMALGEAKMKKKIAICTTSGTAVLECLPALCEAFYSEVELTLITADRPQSLSNSAAPQTIDQLSSIKPFCHNQVNLAFDDLNSYDFKPSAGVNHININIGQSSKDSSDTFELEKYKKTLFLFSHGDYDFDKCCEIIKSKTEYFYFEVLSSQGHQNIFPSEKQLINFLNDDLFDSIVRIGHTPLSKLWRIIDEKPLPVLHIDPRGYKALSYGELKKLEPNQVLAFLEGLTIPYNKLSSFETYNFDTYPHSQFQFIKILEQKLPDNAHIYLGNSSIIRDFEVAFKKPATFYGNRGANGIDGQISSAIGIAKNLKENLFICIGDLTFEYDWAALKYLPDNCILFIFNNGGGKIFERIDVHQDVILEHQNDYEKLITSFGIDYYKINNIEELSFEFEIKKPRVYELNIDPAQTLKCFRELL